MNIKFVKKSQIFGRACKIRFQVFQQKGYDSDCSNEGASSKITGGFLYDSVDEANADTSNIPIDARFVIDQRGHYYIVPLANKLAGDWTMHGGNFACLRPADTNTLGHDVMLAIHDRVERSSNAYLDFLTRISSQESGLLQAIAVELIYLFWPLLSRSDTLDVRQPVDNADKWVYYSNLMSIETTGLQRLMREAEAFYKVIEDRIPPFSTFTNLAQMYLEVRMNHPSHTGTVKQAPYIGGCARKVALVQGQIILDSQNNDQTILFV